MSSIHLTPDEDREEEEEEEEAEEEEDEEEDDDDEDDRVMAPENRVGHSNFIISGQGDT